MIGLRNLKVNETETLGKTFILTGITPKFKYDSGVKTEKEEGYYYSVLCVDKGYMAIRVAVSGERKIPMEDVAENPKVAFDGLRVHLYYIDRRVVISVTADSIRVVKT